MGYSNTIDYLYGLQGTGIKLGLDNIRALLSRLGDPQHAFRTAHVAGTNGKGSTAAMLASFMEKAGRRTGLFTSPHLLSFTERIKIDGTEITEREVVETAAGVRSASEGLDPTFFEVVTAMAFVIFREQGVEWAVVETGLGGRLDSTNVIRPEATVITPVGLDHAEFLGDALEGVAREKAGTIKEGVPVVSARQAPEALSVIEETAARKSAPLFLEGRDFRFEPLGADPGTVGLRYSDKEMSIPRIDVPLRGEYQAQNAALAVRAFALTAGEMGTDRIAATVTEGAGALKWPGRLEQVADGPPVYVDGGHNPSASEALSSELRTRPIAPPEKLILVLGVMRDKDVEGILRPLLEVSRDAICTAPGYGRAVGPEELAGRARRLGFNARGVEGVGRALDEARRTGKSVLVAGSFYTAGDALMALGAEGVLTRLRECAPG
jgi:dihydrofolate synthase/folylpolyglutamate synthase